MDIYKLKFTRLQNEIFRLLCIKAGKHLNQREISNFLKVSPTAVAKSLKQLKKQNLANIKKPRKMNLTLIELNRDNQRTVELKRIENLKMIYESKILEFLEEKFPGTTIILFGSYSKGEDNSESDVDIAIIGTKPKKVDLGKFDRLLKREIILNFYFSWKEIHKNLKDNILNGIVLAGGIEL